MEDGVEQLPGDELRVEELVMPGAKQPQGVSARGPMRAFGQEVRVAHHVEPREPHQPGVGRKGHDVALARDSPLLQNETRQPCVAGTNRLGAR